MRLLANPYVLLGLLAFVAAVGAVSYSAGQRHAANACASIYPSRRGAGAFAARRRHPARGARWSG